MSSPAGEEQNMPPKSRSLVVRFVLGCLKFLVSAAIVVGAILLYQYQIRTSPQAQRAKLPSQTKLVQVIPVQQADCATTIDAMGTVVPSQQVTLRPQVTGQIVALSPEVIPGGVVRKGQLLASIDSRDYEVLVRQRQGEVDKAIERLKIEQGNQAVARQEFALLGDIVDEEDRELILREPQLVSARSALDSARSALEKAQLDLARCQIVVPFNGIVQNKHVDVGAVVGMNTDLVTLVGTDAVWIEVMIRVDQLQWLDIPQRNGNIGSSVTIHNDKVWGVDRVRKGTVVRLGSELETQARWARLLVVVDDPFCLKTENQYLPQLLVGTYVRVEIEGRRLTNVFPVAWSHLRDNNTVWIMDDKQQLEIRTIEIIFSDEPDRVFVHKGLKEGELLVVTDLAAPVAGMPLRVAKSEESGDAEELAATVGRGEQQ
ncbi:MAG: efflux RND transporter periplasmic adaptor subunit [Sedimentisphaerales bacterium]|nr:efflux RND transporter periplasmic adaptor subunit [Sedimentisphaerales bacterium]